MSEIVMTNQANPGALGANLSALFFNLSGQPCYVGNDGIQHILLEDPGTFANISVTNNLALSDSSSGVAGNVTLNALTGRAVAAIGQTLLQVTNNRVTASSHVFVMPSANDTTGRVTAVVPGTGNFRVSLVGPAANMPLDFVVFNPA